jgi:hypothetical protein
MSEIKNQNKKCIENTKNEAKEKRKDLKFLCYGIPGAVLAQAV